MEIGCGESWQSIGQNFKVVEYLQLIQAKRTLQMAAFERPGTVGQLDAVAVDRGSHGKCGALYGFRSKLNFLQIGPRGFERTGEISAAQGDYVTDLRRMRTDQRKSCIGSADIGNQNTLANAWSPPSAGARRAEPERV